MERDDSEEQKGGCLLLGRIIREKRMIQYAAAHRFYLASADYWMSASAGMTAVLLGLGGRYPFPLPRMKSKSQPSSACRMVSLNRYA
jgi:hypothetical protein